MWLKLQRKNEIPLKEILASEAFLSKHQQKRYQICNYLSEKLIFRFNRSIRFTISKHNLSCLTGFRTICFS